MALDLRRQIDDALSNGKRMFDDATILFKNNSWRSCAVYDIQAYEEFNKALKMAQYHLRGQPFRNSDMERLTDGKSHKQKVLLHAVSFGNMLKGDSMQMYNGRRNFAMQIGLPFPRLPREMAIVLHNDTTKYFAKLHDLRKTLQYSGTDNRRFDDATLKAICGYLHYEAIIPYYETRFNLFLFDNGMMWQHSLTSEQLVSIRENRDKVALSTINLLCQMPTFIMDYQVVREVIDSLPE